MSERTRCAFQPYMNTCDRPGGYGGYCLHHSNTHCTVCGQQATHMCGGWVGSFVCGADVCDECDSRNRSGPNLHLCGSLPARSVTREEFNRIEAERRVEYEAANERAKARIAEERAAERAALAAIPPSDWTPAGVLQRNLKLSIYCPACEVHSGFSVLETAPADRPISTLRFKCSRCGGPGEAIAKRNRVKWWNLTTGASAEGTEALT